MPRLYIYLVEVTNGVHAQIILVRRSHWPGLELLVRLEIVPCLTPIDVLHAPSRMVGLEVLGMLIVNGAVSRAIGRAIGGLHVASPPDAHCDFLPKEPRLDRISAEEATLLSSNLSMKRANPIGDTRECVRLLLPTQMVRLLVVHHPINF